MLEKLQMARLTIRLLRMAKTMTLPTLERFSSYEKKDGGGKDCENRRQRNADSARENESRIKILVEVLLQINNPN